MKLWVATGAREEWVDIIFFDKPGPEKWVDWLPGHGDGGEGYWGVPENGITMERSKAAREFAILPRHGTKELIEYEITGNGRRTE
jgi:hypothetical protein